MGMKDGLGDRMKLYEGIESDRILLPRLPICARLDGRAFHTFARGLNRPYDERLSSMMIETTKYLVETTHALIGYTQSDEISLIFAPSDKKSESFFGGRPMKMASVLASIATAKFNDMRATLLPKKQLATFDCRIWNVPSLDEAANTLLWREWDASKNSISMAASAYYSPSQLHGKNGSEKQEMLHQVGVNWNDYPAFFKRGSYIRRESFTRGFTADELSKLPEKHAAKLNPGLLITRSEVREIDMPIFSKVINRNGVIFFGESPTVES